jgi:hypothetical protein
VAPQDIPVSVRLRQRRSGRWSAIVRFTAPVAITDASSSYEIRYKPPPRKNRGWTHAMYPTDRNIAQGETVTVHLKSLRDAGLYRGAISYRRAIVPGEPVTDPRGVRIGRFSFRVP